MSSINTELLDQAVKFAIDCHSGLERRGKGYPYSVHIMEAVAIAATMTADQELLAAAALHDVIEDTDATEKVIRESFGDRVADLVMSESEVPVEGMSSEDSWHLRKAAAISRIAGGSRDEKIVAMSDKLSNMRAIAMDHRAIGSELWQRFHVKDPAEHSWHYRGLAAALQELSDTPAYMEFVRLIDEVFGKDAESGALYEGFSWSGNEERIYVTGILNGENAEELLRLPYKSLMLDFSQVSDITFSGMRDLVREAEKGREICIVNASDSAFMKMNNSGLGGNISIFRHPLPLDMSEWEEFGGGAQAVSYYSQDGERMMKLYSSRYSERELEQEKRMAQRAMLCGVPTPMTGELVSLGDQRGLEFERIKGKRSFARAMADEPENIEKLSVEFAAMVKKLHSTECDTRMFSPREDFYRTLLKETELLDSRAKDKISGFLNSVKKKTTCLHGDLHLGNAILTDKDSMFIDMGDFSYGEPLFDIGSCYFTSHYLSEERCMELYHIDCAAMKRFWPAFAREYFQVSEEGQLQAVERGLKPYAGLMALFYVKISGHISEDLRRALNEGFDLGL